jgi:formate dehydrogenase major subunit
MQHSKNGFSTAAEAAASTGFKPVSFILDGSTVTCRADQTILQAAQQHGVEIPRLCYMEGMRPDGNCRTCMVEIKGERVLAPSCCRYPKEGMEVTTNSPRALTSQKMCLELLLSDMPEASYTLNSELDLWARKLSIGKPRFGARPQPVEDLSHAAMAVHLDACIQCNRCVRACREVQVNDVIGYAFRGAHSKIVFDLDDPMGNSTCVACGECVQSCPTGALMPARAVGQVVPDRQVDSVCPYCGVGCQLTYQIRDNKILYVKGRNGPSNSSRLCVKGRYGFDYVQHKHRLTRPLIRKPGAPKYKDFVVDPENWQAVFREATWEEALDFAARGLREARDTYGKRALAGFGSAKGTNEEAYLFQKLVRTGFGSNNVDHCTRLCHASSVAALMEGINSGAVSNQVRDVAIAEVIFVIGANPTVNHPVAATWIKNAAKAGATLIVADPRRGDLARHATYFLQFNPDTDVALLNAMLHVIVEEGLVDQAFVRDRTSGYEALAENVRKFSPELMAPICGIDAQTIRKVARLYATSKGSMILWGMGISQHVHGTDNARCLIALALSTGQIGKPGSGLHPLRGQNNVQGASDSGLIPMFYPDYQRVGTPEARERFEKLWGVELDPDPGLTVVEIMHAAKRHEIRAMYVMGENPAMSDPDVDHAREALCALDHLVVQDIFLTETAYLADVVLPATAWPEKIGTVTNTDRMVQLGRKAIEPPGQAREDFWIINELARRTGVEWYYRHPREVFEEMRKSMDSIGGITWERLERESSVTYPCVKEGDPGDPVVFIKNFPTKSGRGKFVPADLISAAERPDEEYPMVLITGRQLEHWHTGAMTRRASALDYIEPEPVASVHPLDLEMLHAEPGGIVTIESRRGRISLYARADDGTPRGAVFVPFCYYEAAANMLTNPVLDPFGKIPEFKYCAVRVTKGGPEPKRLSFGGGVLLSEREPAGVKPAIPERELDPLEVGAD